MEDLLKGQRIDGQKGASVTVWKVKTSYIFLLGDLNSAERIYQRRREITYPKNWRKESATAR